MPEDTMPDTQGINLFEIDVDLQQILRAALPEAEYGRATPHLLALGALAGAELDSLARTADVHTPILRTYDQRGKVINEVDYHPAYTAMERLGVETFGLVAMSHRPVLDFGSPLKHTLKYAFWYLFVQAEFALACPMSMTDSAVRVLRRYGSAELNERYADPMLLTEPGYYSGAQFMTEKQGGSDVGANVVRAEQVDGEWRLWGDKWFCSNVSADLALVLARPSGAPEGTRGLAMFLMPRRLPDGSMNSFRINRLKDKLGTRGMASGEITFNGAVCYQVGDLGTGFKQMMSMVNSSRLSNAMRSAALMRRSYVEALTSAQGRAAFGSPLAEKPLMRSTLFRMLFESEAAAATLFHTAAVYDRADEAVARLPETERAASVPGDDDSRHVRLLTPILKGVICKRARHVVGEGMEARGGNGYIDEWVDGKLLRDAHLGSIWEGTTSIVALDVQRAILRNRSDEPFFEDIRERLARIIDSETLGGLAGLLNQLLNRAQVAAERLPRLPVGERELGAVEQMNDMYDLLAASLLLEQAQAAQHESRNFRKLAVVVGYVEQHILGRSSAQELRSSFLLGTAASAVLAHGEVAYSDVERALFNVLATAEQQGLYSLTPAPRVPASAETLR